ncbi:MAG: orotate phosphoribosyltransferase [Hydrogenophilus sp.]|nr:orotate phosphoribosyltransferase [Hydrogenophilus sp.]
MERTTAEAFLRLAVTRGALAFGEFRTKAGRISPYFFDSGRFSDGASFAALCGFYAETVLRQGMAFDALFGPAYKGIPLVAGVAMELARRGVNRPFAFNRKEAKGYGEGGVVVGGPLTGKVLIVDDVISAGTSVRQSVALIRDAGGEPAGVVIALDREERGKGEASAVAEVEAEFGIPVVAVARLRDLLAWLAREPRFAAEWPRVEAYRQRYGTGG